MQSLCLGILDVVSNLAVGQMEVLVAPCDSFWDHEVSMPVQKHFRCEVLVIVSEQVPDVPVTMVIPLDSLI